jgi:MFS family permease
MQSQHWKRNLYVCFFGSFINIVAMTLLLPFLPLFVEDLGVKEHVDVVQWSGIAYGATFFSAALVAPLWGRMADRYGYKTNLIRASFGMMVSMGLTGLVTNIWQLVTVRLIVGLAGGYTSGSYAIVAAQTPKERSAWALGILSASIMAGSLIGPLIGGSLPSLIGVRNTFFLAAGCIFFNVLATCLGIKDSRRPEAGARTQRGRGPVWSSVRNGKIVAAMLTTASLLMIANMSIEPIIAVYVQELLHGPDGVAVVSGVTMSVAALGSALSASRLGKMADTIGSISVVIGCLFVSAVLLIPQAFVTEAWQLIALRFLMGLSLGGLLPSLTSLIRHNVEDHAVGRMLGYSTSAQYAGQVIGPLLGGFVGGHFGMRLVFLATSALLFGCAAYDWSNFRNMGVPAREA